MKITFIHHSSFLVELDDRYLLFDYYDGDLPSLSPHKALYIFASHHHGDHFSPAIFDFISSQALVHYILSDDIPVNQVPKEATCKIDWIKPNQCYQINDMNIQTFRSTDEGVACLIHTNTTSIFHAGDLNHWQWLSESAEWNQEMTFNYHQELQKLKNQNIHIAFLPLDPRLETNFYLGIDDFMGYTNTDIIFPMHFWGDFDTITRFKALPQTSSYREKIMEIKQKGDSYDIN